MFVAVNHERLPKYGPEEVNICTVVEKQVRLDAKLDNLSAIGHEPVGLTAVPSEGNKPHSNF